MSEWIKWEGGECPVNGDKLIDVKHRDGTSSTGIAISYKWDCVRFGSDKDIIAYRLCSTWNNSEDRIDTIGQNGNDGQHYNATRKAPDFLRAAIEHMEERAEQHDSPEGERSIGAAVEAFNLITRDGLMSSEERGWLFMAILKMVRSQQGAYNADDYEDGAAYFALAGESAEMTFSR